MPRDDPRQILPIPTRFRARARDIWHGAVTRRLVTPGVVPDSLVYRPVALDVGSQDEADAMLRGMFRFHGSSIKVERGDPWRVIPPSTAWATELHGFAWLSHFRAGDGPASRTAARRFVDGWLHRHGKGAGFSWRPAIAGERLTSWCMSATLLMENAEPLYRSEFLKSIGVQGRYLLKTAAGERDPMERMRAGMGLAYAGLCLPDQRTMLTEGLKIVAKAAMEVTLPDGGPVSRNPSMLLERMERLLQLETDLESAGESKLATRLHPMVAAAAPVLRMLRHGDGGLAMFHGGREEGAERVNRVLVESGETAPPPGETPDSGFMRLSAGRANVIFDAGPAPVGRNSRRAHAGPLAIEVSIGRRRIITNCGSGIHLDPVWEQGCRSSAAHSTLTLADHPPGKFQGKTTARLRRLIEAPRIIDREREDDEDGIWALAAHDGYARKYGLIHYRRLFLAPDGLDLRGEDTLTLVKGGARILERARARRKSPDGPGYTVRFHLHPDVETEIVGKGAILTLASGEHWRILQSGGAMTVEDSIYLPRAASPKPSKQIVVRAVVGDDGGQVRWALKRLESGEYVRDFEPDVPVDNTEDETTAPPED